MVLKKEVENLLIETSDRQNLSKKEEEKVNNFLLALNGGPEGYKAWLKLPKEWRDLAVQLLKENNSHEEQKLLLIRIGKIATAFPAVERFLNSSIARILLPLL